MKYMVFVLFGIAIGILYAPKKGSVLRREIKYCLENMQEDATTQTGVLKCEGEELVRTVSQKIQQAYEKSQSALQVAQERAVCKGARRVVG